MLDGRVRIFESYSDSFRNSDHGTLEQSRFWKLIYTFINRKN